MDFYSDNDAFAAAWLRELITAGHLPQGIVDERSINQLSGTELAGFRQCHLFAGIGGWPYALQLAGWPGDRPVWTGSCPCQPFSAAGKRKGQADERHLWPVFFRLIRECKPPTVFGEQVASDDGYRWLARVRDDLEEAGYAVGCADLPACCAGAPHIRQRLFWVANSQGQRWRISHASNKRAPNGKIYAPSNADHLQSRRLADSGRAGLREQRQPMAGEAGGNQGEGHQRQWVRDDAGNGGDVERLADADGRDAGDGNLQRSGQQRQQPQDGGTAGGVEHAASNGRIERRAESDGRGAASGCEFGRVGDADGAGHQRANGTGKPRETTAARPCPDDPCGTSFWSASRIIHCRDDKYRRVPVEPALFPLAPRLPGRVGMLRGAGNSIVPQVAAKFIRAFLEAESELSHD